MHLEIWLLIGTVLLLFAAALLTVMSKQARKLIIRHIDFSKPGNRPLRCVLLSDLHVSRLPIHWDYIFTKISKEQPDFLLIAGDLANGEKDGPAILDFFTVLTAYTACPVYVVYGNHDNNHLFHNEPSAKKIFTKRLTEISSRIRVLENESELFQSEDRSILLCGLGDVQSNQADVAALLRQKRKEADAAGAALLLLSHNPDILLRLDPRCADFGFFGHTHNGQVLLPFRLEFKLLRRKDILPGQGYIYGPYTYKEMPIYISAGLGNSVLAIRYKTTPEIVSVLL